MMRFAPLFVGGLQIVTVEGREAPFSCKEQGNQRWFSSQPLLPRSAIKFSQYCAFSRDTPSGLPSLATASYFLSPVKVSAKIALPVITQ